MALSKVGINKNKKISSGFISGAGAGKSEKSSASEIQAPNNISFKNALETQSSEASQSTALSILQQDGTIDEALLAELQDVIHTTGDLLLAKPGYNTVLDYKRAVQALLKSIIPHLHNKESIIAPKKNGQEIQHRKFTLINKVNEKLDVVLKIVLSSQADQMWIMKELDEIHGLIINILH